MKIKAQPEIAAKKTEGIEFLPLPTGTSKGSPSMLKRTLKGTKWLGTIPIGAICTACCQNFKVPFHLVDQRDDARANLQRQFEVHKCMAEYPKRPAMKKCEEDGLTPYICATIPAYVAAPAKTRAAGPHDRVPST